MADRYWVGGSGNWDTSTTNWSATSGGAGGASAPTAADNVFFNSASASGNYTVATVGGIAALDLNIAKAAAGTVTFTGTGTLNVSGNLNTVGAGVTWNVTTNFTFNGSNVSVTTGGVTFNRFVFSAVGGTFTLQDAMTVIVAIGLNNGTLNLNNQTVTTPVLNCSGGAARTIDFDTSSVINIPANNSTLINAIAATGLTILGTSTVNLTYSGNTGTRTVTVGAGLVGNFNVNVTAGSDTLTIGAVLGDLNFTGFSGTLNATARTLFGNLTLSTGMTVAGGATVTSFVNTSGTTTIDTKGRSFPQQMTFNGVGGTRRLLGNVDSTGRIATLTAGNLDLDNFVLSAATFTTSGTSDRQIQFGTTGAINLTANGSTVWNFPTVTGFSYTGNAAVNLTYAGGTGTRTVTHGTTGGSEANKPPPFYIPAGTDNVSVGTASVLSDMDFTGFSGSFTATARTFYGNLILSTGMIVGSGAVTTTFSGNVATQTIVTNGRVINVPVTIFKTGGNFVLSDALVMGTARSITVNGGNLIANGKNITTDTFSSSNLNPRVIDISNTTVTLVGIGTVWNMSASGNATVIATGSTINTTNDATATKVFAGGNLTYGNYNIGGNGVSTTSFTGNNTFAGAITSTKPVAHTVSFTAGTTTTVGGFGISGSAGNVVTITSVSAAPHNLVFTGAGTVNTSWANISYSNASPANKWYSLLTNNNTDSGNNAGWIFTAAANSNMFLVF